MRPVHVIIDHAYGQDEVDVKVIDEVDDEAQSHDEACVLEVGQLDVHCSEFNTPSNV